MWFLVLHRAYHREEEACWFQWPIIFPVFGREGQWVPVTSIVPRQPVSLTGRVARKRLWLYIAAYLICLIKHGFFKNFYYLCVPKRKFF
jgi:hypothetical protein